MKKFVLTEADRGKVLRLMRTRSYTGARNYLNQLKEIKENPVEKYFCSVHKGEGNPDCKECWEKLNQLAKDNNARIVGP